MKSDIIAEEGVDWEEEEEGVDEGVLKLNVYPESRVRPSVTSPPPRLFILTNLLFHSRGLGSHVRGSLRPWIVWRKAMGSFHPLPLSGVHRLRRTADCI